MKKKRIPKAEAPFITERRIHRGSMGIRRVTSSTLFTRVLERWGMKLQTWWLSECQDQIFKGLQIVRVVDDPARWYTKQNGMEVNLS
eukprot:1145490-Pelagomonas_calceolata.AAC.2